MIIWGTKVPMERTANGFRVVVDDDFLENVIQFFMQIYSNPTGTGGEVEWDHSMGTPWDMARHRNVRAGLVERYVAITIERFKVYAGDYLRFTGVQRVSDATTAVRLIWDWRNLLTGKVSEEATSVEFNE